jgi:hypothetical protein
MVCANHVYAAVGESKPKGLAVCSGLDGGIALDKRALGGIIGICEPKMCGTCLSGELLALKRAIIEQIKLAGGGKVQYVQVHAGSCSYIKRL